MAIPITIPRLGWNMDEGRFVGWLKKDGDRVRAGDMLFSLEGEKATEEIECLDAGVLRVVPTVKDGDTVAVGAVIGYLLQEGDPTPQPPPLKREGESGDGPPAVCASASEVIGLGAIPPEAHLQTPPPSSGEGVGGWGRVSPRARRAAKQLGVDLSAVRGSGRTGRIREQDVRAAAPPATPERLPLTAIRKAIARRMTASRQTTAPVTLTTNTDATNFVGLREQFKSAARLGQGLVPGFTDFLVKLVAIALQKHPLLNARWGDDRIELSPSVHISFAVDTDAGLLVPVLRDVPSLSLKRLATRSRELVERARQGRLSAEEMQGGTFTITNLGAFGIDAFTPIINAPECAILGVGRIQKQPVVLGSEVVIRDRMTLSLTFDHRLVDGARAARFLQTLTQLIENPGPWLINGELT